MPAWLLSPTTWLAAITAAAALFGYVQTTRLGGCQAELRGARAQLSALGAQVELQNRAVAELEDRAKERAAEASRALQAAREEAGRARSQADALERALAQRRAPAPPSKVAAKPAPVPTAPPGSACPAGDAVQEIRRALAIR